MITISFPASYLPLAIFWAMMIATGFSTLSEPIANLIKRKSQTVADVMACVVVGLLFMVIGVSGAAVTWPN